MKNLDRNIIGLCEHTWETTVTNITVDEADELQALLLEEYNQTGSYFIPTVTDDYICSTCGAENREFTAWVRERLERIQTKAATTYPTSFLGLDNRDLWTH